MPAANRRDLFLQVSANVDNMTAAMKAGRTALLTFGTTASDLQEDVQKAFAQMGANAPAAAKAIEQSYARTFEAIRRNAQAVMNAPTNEAAAGILNANASREAATAAAAQASQLEMLASAASRVAERQGEAGAGARILATALGAQAVEAKQSAAALARQAEVLEEVAIEAKVSTGAANDNTAAHGRMGIAGMEAEHVVRALSDSIAAGQSPVRALSMEFGRITEALAFYAQTTEQTEGAVGKFAGFMGGPWGIALSAAAAVLAPLVADMFEAHDAAVEAKLGADGLSDAQSVLGKMFDLTSGKLERQNSLMRLNAQLTAINLRAKASSDDASSQGTFAQLGTSSWGNFFSPQYLGSEVGAAPRELIAMVRSGRLSPADAAKRAETVDMTGSKVSRSDFLTALAQMVGSQYESRTADQIDTSLSSGVLSTDLRNQGRGGSRSRTRSGRSAKAADPFKLAAIPDAADLYDPAAVEATAKKFADHQHDEFTAIFGSGDPLADVLAGATDAQKARVGEWDKAHGGGEKGPLERYRDQLVKNVGDMNTALQNVAAEGLQGLEDGLLNVINGTGTLAGAFKSMASSIVADLARIAIEKAIVAGLDALIPGAGSFLGFLKKADGGEVKHLAGGGHVFGPGGPREDRIPAMLSAGEFVINAASTKRHRALIEAINSGRLPGLADGGLVNPSSIYMRALPSPASVSRMHGSTVQQHFHIDASNSILASDLLMKMQQIGVVAMAGGAHQAQQEIAEAGAQRIPS